MVTYLLNSPQVLPTALVRWVPNVNPLTVEGDSDDEDDDREYAYEGTYNTYVEPDYKDVCIYVSIYASEWTKTQ